MKKKIMILMLAASTFTITACGRDKIISTGNERIADAVYDDDFISLAAYTGLEAEKKVYEVTDEAVETEIHDQLSDFAEYESVDRAAQEGDWLNVDYTVKVDGETYDRERSYDLMIGSEEYGKAFDQKLIGVSAGENLSFSLDYGPDTDDMDLAGKTADFEISVNDVQEEILPETTDQFIQENLEYDSYEEFVAAARGSVTETYESESNSALYEDLIQQVMDASSILQYTSGAYDDAYESTENSYKDYADTFQTDLETIYDSFGITKEDLKEEALHLLYRTMTINAIAENESLSLSDDDYEEGIAYYMEINGYDSKEEFLDDYGEEEIRRQLTEDKVMEFLASHASITEVDAEYEE